MATAHVDQGTSRAGGSFRANYESSLGSLIKRRGGIGNVLKTLGIAKVEQDVHVNVGKDQSSGRFFNTTSKFDEAGVSADGEGSVTRTLGVSLLGACSSKGCPTKSVENEDRYAHGKINLDLRTLQGLPPPPRKQSSKTTSGSRKPRTGSGNAGTVPCWAFATFDGHAGPACAHYLKENFMAHLRKTERVRCKAAETAARMTAQQGNSNNNSADADADAAAGGANGGGGGGDAPSPQKQQQPNPAVEVILARLLTDTLTSLTREFEKDALMSGEISGACVICGLYSQGALVLANVGDCQAVYHGQVKSAPGSPVTAQTTVHDASNPAEVTRFLTAGGFMSATGRFQGVLEPSRTVGDVDVKADAPKGAIASYPELFKVDIASEVFRGDEKQAFPPFLVLATDGIWDEMSANTVVDEVKDGIAKIQAHKRRFAIRKGKHRRDSSFGSTTFTDGESDSEDESEFCGSGEWAEQGMDLAERVVSLARGRYDDATALVVVFE